MSLPRPPLARFLGRWREPLAWGAAAAALLLLALDRHGRGQTLWALLAAAGGLAALAFGWAAREGVRLRAAAAGPGVLVAAERRILFMGPEGGGFVDLADLARVEIAPGAAGPCWRLHAADGRLLEIPAGARGAERLHAALAALPGADWTAAAEALAGRRPGAVAVWETRRRPSAHLARPGARP